MNNKPNPQQDKTNALKSSNINDNIKTQNSQNSNNKPPNQNTLIKNASTSKIKSLQSKDKDNKENFLNELENELDNTDINKINFDNRSLRDDVTNTESLLLDENKLKDDYVYYKSLMTMLENADSKDKKILDLNKDLRSLNSLYYSIQKENAQLQSKILKKDDTFLNNNDKNMTSKSKRSNSMAANARLKSEVVFGQNHTQNIIENEIVNYSDKINKANKDMYKINVEYNRQTELYDKVAKLFTKEFGTTDGQEITYKNLD